METTYILVDAKDHGLVLDHLAQGTRPKYNGQPIPLPYRSCVKFDGPHIRPVYTREDSDQVYWVCTTNPADPMNWCRQSQAEKIAVAG